MRFVIRLRPALLLAAAIALAGCAGQAAPTITPAPTVDTTALAAEIQAAVFSTLAAEPTVAPPPSLTPAPTLDTAALAAEIQAAVFGTLTAQPTFTLAPSATPAPSDTPAPTLDVDALASTAAAGVPTLDLGSLVEAVSVAQALTATAQQESLLATQAAQQAAQATQQAERQATQIALENQPVAVSADDDPALGPEDAAVVVIIFSDFTCSYCASFALTTFPRLLEAYGDQVRFVFRDAPILSANSGWAALAAQCANDQDKFWEYHDLLFANQRSISPENLVAFAAQLELDVDEFSDCLESQKHLDELRNDLADAQAAGLTGTPTFFINGRRVVGAQPFEVFAQIIEEELAK